MVRLFFLICHWDVSCSRLRIAAKYFCILLHRWSKSMIVGWDSNRFIKVYCTVQFLFPEKVSASLNEIKWTVLISPVDLGPESRNFERQTTQIGLTARARRAAARGHLPHSLFSGSQIQTSYARLMKRPIFPLVLQRKNDTFEFNNAIFFLFYLDGLGSLARSHSELIVWFTDSVVI
jgi:hypothetical protein